MTPKVSVLVPTYNRAALLPESLESIFSQTVPPSQVIVINDGSTDDTRKVVESYGRKIEYLEQQPNQGKSTALNLGMQRTTGDYVWIMDDDDIAFPDALERHLAILERNPQLGFTYSGGSVPDENGIHRVYIPPDSSNPNLLLCLLRGYFLGLEGILVRTSCYREVGEFDPEMLRSQDYEMTIRLLYRFPCARIDGPTFAVRWDFAQRGPARDRFPFRKVLLKGMEYQRKAFRKVRKELPLHCYLSGPTDTTGELTASDTRRALLRRASIMALKGLPAETADDLRLAVLASADPLSSAERSILWEFEWCADKAPAMFDLTRNQAVLHNVAVIMKSKALKGKGLAFDIKCDWARGLFWRVNRLWRENDRTHAVVFLFSACRIMGVRGLLEVGFQKARAWRAPNSNGGAKAELGPAGPPQLPQRRQDVS
ncbi:MAG TPA: glycosyltransferase family A protein [Patescibacteria group bacterium]|nr:glycosyltransferase family A protein [Patescibacteria group bacterium]